MGYFTSWGNVAYATDSNFIKVDDNNVESLIETVAQDWAETTNPEISLYVSDIVRINTPDSSQVQYAASYYHDTTPYGYVVIGSYNNDMTVMEASIVKGREGLYTDIVDDIIDTTKKSRKEFVIDKEIVKVAPLEYALKYTDKQGKKHITDNYGTDYSNNKQLVASTEYSSPGSIFIPKQNWKSTEYKVDSSSQIILDKYTKRMGLIDEQTVESYTNKYACSVQALLQIAFMEGLTDIRKSNVINAYNKLWE
ncbi:MAG: hypothetical protein QM689_06875 [Oscillospiraceae bacterium]